MSPPSAPLSLRVLTVNTHKGFGFLNRKFILHELREAVRSVSADIVFLQEVIGTHELHAARVANGQPQPHYEYLADTIWSDFAYGRNAVYPQGDHGNAVLSKYPIVRHDNIDLSGDDPAGHGAEKRGLLHCVLRVPRADGGDAVELHAVCVHLGLKERQRERQLALVCDMVRDSVPPEAPLVIAGDFNDWRLRAHRILARCAGLQETYQHAHGRMARTFPAHWPLLRLDRIYVRGVAAHRPLALSRRPWWRLSDHAPLAAEITL